MQLNKKHTVRDVIVVGFALFAMFFGAGNVIFPPYLGVEAGPDWLRGLSPISALRCSPCSRSCVSAAARR